MNRPNFGNPYEFGSPFGGPPRGGGGGGGGYNQRGSPRHGSGGGGFRTPSPHHHPHHNMPPPPRPFSPQYGGPPPPSPDFSPRGMRSPYRQNYTPRPPYSGGGNHRGGGWSPNRSGGYWGRGRGGFSPSHGHFKHRDRNPGSSDNIEDYCKDSMLADPWEGMVPVPVTRPLDFTT